MILPDVNVLVYAFWKEAPDHARYRAWILGVLAGDQAYGMSEFVLSGMLRIVTNPRIFTPPEPIEAALSLAEEILRPPTCVRISPGPRHWDIFARLCRETGAKGNAVPDAYLAALAIESGCELITADRGFDRFKGLRSRHPFA